MNDTDLTIAYGFAVIALSYGIGWLWINRMTRQEFVRFVLQVLAACVLVATGALAVLLLNAVEHLGRR